MKVNDEKFNFEFKKDPKLTGDTKIKIGKETVDYNYITQNFPINKDKPMNILVYWDDVCQFTSLGLIEVVNCLLNCNAKIDIEHFLSRPNEFSNGMKYVYKLFEKSVKSNQIDQIKKKYYWKILEMSVKSSIYASLMKINTFVSRIGFVFPYKFTNCDSLRLGLNKCIFDNTKQDGVTFYYENEREFNSILKDGYNCIITPNISQTYKYILDNNLTHISIIGPEDHHGMDDQTINLLKKMNNCPKPNSCSISLYNEQLFL